MTITPDLLEDIRFRNLYAALNCDLLSPVSISSPAKYTSCRNVAHSIAASLSDGFRTGLGEKADWASVEVCVRESMPFHFVGADLVEAAKSTTPPHDVLLSDIPWPRSALIFMLPSGAYERRGLPKTALVFARLQTGETIPCALREHVFGRVNLPRNLRDEVQPAEAWFAGTVSQKNGISIYNCDAMLCVKKASTVDDLFQDLTEIEVDDECNPSALALNLLCIMQAQPGLITGGECLRRAIPKEGKRAIFDAKWIGRHYFIRREAGTGSHASPRTHWRNGHWRQQPYGEKSQKRKLIWIEPMLVAATPQQAVNV